MYLVSLGLLRNDQIHLSTSFSLQNSTQHARLIMNRFFLINALRCVMQLILAKIKRIVATTIHTEGTESIWSILVPEENAHGGSHSSQHPAQFAMPNRKKCLPHTSRKFQTEPKIRINANNHNSIQLKSSSDLNQKQNNNCLGECCCGRLIQPSEIRNRKTVQNDGKEGTCANDNHRDINCTHRDNIDIIDNNSDNELKDETKESDNDGFTILSDVLCMAASSAATMYGTDLMTDFEELYDIDPTLFPKIEIEFGTSINYSNYSNYSNYHGFVGDISFYKKAQAFVVFLFTKHSENIKLKQTKKKTNSNTANGQQKCGDQNISKERPNISNNSINNTNNNNSTVVPFNTNRNKHNRNNVRSGYNYRSGRVPSSNSANFTDQHLQRQSQQAPPSNFESNHNRCDNSDNNTQQKIFFKLREIMNSRGIYECSGDCGNSLIKGSLLFYQAILNCKLNVFLFDKYTHLQLHPQKFWHPLISNVFNTQEKREFLSDIICLIHQMWYTVPGAFKYDDRLFKEKWKDEENEDKWQAVVREIISNSKHPTRVAKVKQWVTIMFDCFHPIYQETMAKSKRIDSSDDNVRKAGQESEESRAESSENKLEDFVLNALFRAIMIHSFRNKCDNDNKPPTLTLNLRKIVESSDNKSKCTYKVFDDNRNPTFKQEEIDCWNETAIIASLNDIAIGDAFDIQAIEQMSGQKLKDFMLMRLLVLTMNFMVECETILDMKIKCIDHDVQMTNFQRLEKEFKQQGLHSNLVQFLKDNSKNIKTIYESKRNQNMKQNRLCPCEIRAIRLFTDDQICTKIKEAHRQGISCHFRNTCKLIYSGLFKLRHFDSEFSDNMVKAYKKSYFENKPAPSLYSGIRDVILDDATAPEKQRLVGGDDSHDHENMNVNMYARNDEEYYWWFHTLTSASMSYKVAKQFSKSRSCSKSVMFEIKCLNLIEDKKLVYGDISWISKYPKEKEILFAPCMIHIFAINKPDFARASDFPQNIDVRGCEITSPKHIKCLVKNLRRRLAIRMQIHCHGEKYN